LAFMIWRGEAAWLPRAAEGVTDQSLALLIDLAAFGHAVHSVIRPAALLPEFEPHNNAFALAMKRVEFESGRLMQAQIVFLKSPELVPARPAVSAAVERRHAQVRELWDTMLNGLEIEASGRHNLAPAYQLKSAMAAVPTKVIGPEKQ
jgi:hypothetical protein